MFDCLCFILCFNCVEVCVWCPNFSLFVFLAGRCRPPLWAVHWVNRADTILECSAILDQTSLEWLESIIVRCSDTQCIFGRQNIKCGSRIRTETSRPHVGLTEWTVCLQGCHRYVYLCLWMKDGRLHRTCNAYKHTAGVQQTDWLTYQGESILCNIW